jgi:hypothetical protein
MNDEVREHGRQLAKNLEEGGHADHAARVRHVLSGNQVEDAFLWALRGVCDTLLTMVEAIDPVSEMALEGLRSKLDANLGLKDNAKN